MTEKRLAAESISGAFPRYGGPTIFPFSRSNQRSGVLATFDLRAFTSFQPCRLVLSARLSVILRTRLSAHSFIPLAPRACPEMFPSLSPVRFPLLFSELRRFFSIDITPSRLPIAGTEKFRVDSTIREIFLLVAFVLPPLQTVLPFLPRLPPPFSVSTTSVTIFYTHFHAREGRRAKNNGTTSQRGYRDAAERERKGK